MNVRWLGWMLVIGGLSALFAAGCGTSGSETHSEDSDTSAESETSDEGSDPAEIHWTHTPESCTVGATCEFGAALTLAPSNPFDPEELALDADFVSPSGQTSTRPGFYFQDYAADSDDPGAAVGAPEWRVRSLFAERGTWRWRWRLTQAAGTLTSAWHTVSVSAAEWRGPIRVSPKDARFFAFTDGTPYIPIGENVGWYDKSLGEYRRTFDKLQAVGANYARVWMASWGFSLEWTTPEGSVLGDYRLRLDRAWALDRVFEWAAARGVYLMLCTHYHGAFSTGNNAEWSGSPYNTANGGPLAKPEDFFTSEEAAKLTTRRLRYVIARYGASPALFSWELFNEVDLTDQKDPTILAAWHDAMAKEIKRLDPTHLVSTSTSQMAELYGINAPLFGLDSLDFAQVHDYGSNLARENFVTRIPSAVAAFSAYKKPILFAELGTDSRSAEDTLAVDPQFIGLHDIFWIPLFGPSAGIGMTWWWDTVIEAKDLYGQWAPIAAFVKDIPWDSEGFAMAAYTAAHPSKAFAVFALNGSTHSLLWIKNGANAYLKGGDPDSISGATLDLSALPAGTYDAEWLDPYATTSFAPSPGLTNAEHALAIPTFSRDIALRLTRK